MIRLMRFACTSILVSMVFLVPAGAQHTDDPLAGVWSVQLISTAGLRGPLTVTRQRAAWSASLSGTRTDFRAIGNDVRFAFGSGGSFRGVLTDGGKSIEGFWIQPTGRASDPGGPRQAFASPLVLNRAGYNSWSGTVVPLDTRITLYLKIFRDIDGSLLAAFRNPEMNSHGNAPQFHVVQNADTVLFTARPDPTQPEIRLSATLAHSPDRLQLLWPDLGRTVAFVRRSPTEAAAFYARPPGAPVYVYQRPQVTGDGWQTARARDVGMDEAMLAKLVQQLIDSDPAARRPTLIHSLLIAHRGKLVLDEYFFGFDRSQPHDLRSAAKTFASVMLGSAMMHRSHLAPETPVYALLAGMGPFANPDPRKSRITIAQLMTHTSGLACDDNDDKSPGNEDTMQSQTQQPDWWKYTLDLPVAHDPGTRYAYCSAGINLVGAALTTGTATWLPALFDREIARPLQFGPYYWNLMPDGEGYMGGGAYVRPRDLLKLGQAYLDGGTWRGHRIVDTTWVGRSTAEKIDVTEATTGLSSSQFPNYYFRGSDGFAWHLSTLQSRGRSYRDYAATGNGGQLLIVVPDLDLAIVFTAGNYMQGGIWNHFRDQLVPDEIIPAVRR